MLTDSSSRCAAARLLTIFALAALSGCATVRQALERGPAAPSVSVNDVSIAGASFDALDLVFDLQIDNPNSVGVTLSGLEWGLDLAGSRFIGGSQEARTPIQAGGRSHLPIPARIGFADLYSSLTGLNDDDEVPYELSAALGFAVPVLGEVKVPVRHAGRIPLLHAPRLSVSSVDVKALSLFGAELALRLGVENPNGFDLGMNRMDFEFALAGTPVFSGDAGRTANFPSHGREELVIPISVNFTSAGRALVSALGGNEIDCRLQGGMDLEPAHPLIRTLSFPFEVADRVPVGR